MNKRRLMLKKVAEAVKWKKKKANSSDDPVVWEKGLSNKKEKRKHICKKEEKREGNLPDGEGGTSRKRKKIKGLLGGKSPTTSFKVKKKGVTPGENNAERRPTRRISDARKR